MILYYTSCLCITSSFRFWNSTTVCSTTEAITMYGRHVPSLVGQSDLPMRMCLQRPWPSQCLDPSHAVPTIFAMSHHRKPGQLWGMLFWSQRYQKYMKINMLAAHRVLPRNRIELKVPWWEQQIHQCGTWQRQNFKRIERLEKPSSPNLELEIDQGFQKAHLSGR